MTVEEYIYNSIRLCSNVSSDSDKHYHPWLTPANARTVAQLAREEELRYMECQLVLKLPDTLDYNGVKVGKEDFIKDFLKEMKKM